MESKLEGKLSLCATPIGNLEDITLRVLRTLKEADAIWAEDTRHTLGLLNHYGIKKPLVSCHEHNEKARAMEAVEQISMGKRIAYCSDAGMPGISDPGSVLLRAVQDASLYAEVLPGASAVLMSAVLSGISSDSFTFFGFLPRDKKPRRNALARLEACDTTMIIYESPVRIPGTLRELSTLLGDDREAAVLRELTKRYEQVVRAPLRELCARFCEPPKGECVIVLSAKPHVEEVCDEATIRSFMESRLGEGFSVKDAAKEAAKTLNVPKRDAYAIGMSL